MSVYCFTNNLIRYIQPSVTNTTIDKFSEIVKSCLNIRCHKIHSKKVVQQHYGIYTNNPSLDEFTNRHHIGLVLNRDYDKFKEFEFFPSLSAIISSSYNYDPKRSGIWIAPCSKLSIYTNEVPDYITDVSFNLQKGKSGIFKINSKLKKEKKNAINNLYCNSINIPYKLETVRISYCKWSYLHPKDLIAAVYNYNYNEFKQLKFNTTTDAIYFLKYNNIKILIIIDDDEQIELSRSRGYDTFSQLMLLIESGVVSVILDTNNKTTTNIY